MPSLGICFGAQAMAAALGGTVEPAERPEIGWVEVDGAAPFAPGPWLEFHGDRFVPPPDATVLATNPVGVQAFRSGSCLGVQFHPEADADQLTAWIDDGGQQALDAEGIDAPSFVAETASRRDAAATDARRLVTELLEG